VNGEAGTRRPPRPFGRRDGRAEPKVREGRERRSARFSRPAVARHTKRGGDITFSDGPRGVRHPGDEERDHARLTASRQGAGLIRQRTAGVLNLERPTIRTMAPWCVEFEGSRVQTRTKDSQPMELRACQRHMHRSEHGRPQGTHLAVEPAPRAVPLLTAAACSTPADSAIRLRHQPARNRGGCWRLRVGAQRPGDGHARAATIRLRAAGRFDRGDGGSRGLRSGGDRRAASANSTRFSWSALTERAGQAAPVQGRQGNLTPIFSPSSSRIPPTRFNPKRTSER